MCSFHFRVSNQVFFEKRRTFDDSPREDEISTRRDFSSAAARAWLVFARMPSAPVERSEFSSTLARVETSVCSHLGAARAGGAQTFHWVNVVVPPFWLHFRYRPTTRSHYRHSAGGSERDGEGWTNDNGEWLPEQAEWDGQTSRRREREWRVVKRERG